jgi:uncharacterized membrane protein
VTARAEFLATLRAGLRGAPAEAIEEIVADYSAHFDEGVAALRSETDVASALGDPLTLADELRMELRIEAFEASPSTRTGGHVIAGAVASGILNTMLLCVAGPLLAVVALGAVLGILTAMATGIWLLFAGASLELPGGNTTTMLCALGLVSAAVSGVAVFILASKLFVAGIARYARLHYRLLPHSSTTGTTK